ncbi:MAG: hypothetical protein GF364_18735 [Candidatus Lokiarchaeota archaeon]|nr:hypothetical protein [Candidatus Lokiarchaeota archaeon]
MDLKKLNMLDSSAKIVYVLDEYGTSTFSQVVELTNMSRNTVSKYLKELMEKNDIKKEIISRANKRDLMGYSLTEQGKSLLRSELFENIENRWLTSLTERTEAVDHLRTKNLISQSAYDSKKTYLTQIEDAFFNLLNNALNILEFGGQELGAINLLVAEIGNLASKFGEQFFTLPPSLELHLAIIFIFFNSIDNPQFHFTEDYFISTFGQAIDSFKNVSNKMNDIRKEILDNVNNQENLHEFELIIEKQVQNIETEVFNESIYTEALQELKSELSEDFRKNRSNPNLLNNSSNDSSISKKNPEKKPEPLLEAYKDLYRHYISKKHSLLNELHEHINTLISGNYGIHSFLAGGEQHFFHDYDLVGSFLNRRVNDALTEELINKEIFGIKERRPLMEIADDIVDQMVTMHIIWDESKFVNIFCDIVLTMLFQRSEKLGLRKGKNKDKLVDLSEIRGFCPKCGHRILTETNECEFCRSTFESHELILNINKAKHKAAQYQSVQYVETTKTDMTLFTHCKKCGKLVGKTWTMCPICKEKLN